jgi:hypothetical protein
VRKPSPGKVGLAGTRPHAGTRLPAAYLTATAQNPQALENQDQGHPQKPQQAHLGDAPADTSLMRCLPTYVLRGLEPRPIDRYLGRGEPVVQPAAARPTRDHGGMWIRRAALLLTITSAVLLAASGVALAQLGSVPDGDTAQIDGRVRAILAVGDRVYIEAATSPRSTALDATIWRPST